MDTLKTLVFDERTIAYDGRQLSAHWIYRHFDLVGDAVVAFLGPAQVPLEHMVDLEDVKANAPIYSPMMLHFVGEWFDDSLERVVLIQHLFICGIYELLWEKGITGLTRRGNDIYRESRKLSVSIATKSLVSTLIHIGLNVEIEGTPIATSGLSEMGIDPRGFASEVLARFEKEYSICQRARCKVLPRLD